MAFRYLSVVLFTLIAPAVAQDPADSAARCGSAVEWIADTWEPKDGQVFRGRGRTEGTESAPSARRALLDSALARARERNAMVFWYAYRVEGVQMYRAPILDGYARAAFFSDPEIADLLNRRFVPLRMYAEREIGEALGIRALDVVEPALVILSPDGRVLARMDRIRTFNAAFLESWLRQILDENAGLAPRSPGAAAVMIEGRAGPDHFLRLAAEQIRDGDHENALQTLEAAGHTASGDARARIRRLEGAAHRRLGNLPLAVEALEDVPRLTTDAGILREAQVELGRAHLLAGRLREARLAFQAALAGGIEGDRGPEAVWHLALVHMLCGDEGASETMWRDLAARCPESPFAWRAAANLALWRDTTPIGPALHAFEDPFLPPSDAGAPRPSDTRRRRGRDAVRDVARSGVEFLLRHQRSHGGYTDPRYAYWPDSKILPNVRVAVTALAAAALETWQDLDPGRIGPAAERARAFALDETRMNRGNNEEIYADAYRLLMLARHAAVAPPSARAALVGRMTTLVAELQRTQKKNGTWSHEYPNPFSTGAVAQCILMACAAGAGVRDAALRSAAEGLLFCRNEDGAFSYGAGNRQFRGGDREENLKNSMARGPVCESVLFALGRSSEAALAAQFANFWRHMPRFETVRVCDFHSDGELAGFFFFHAFYHGTEALRILPPEAGREGAGRFLDHLLGIGELDGSFIDSHEMGKCYGTAMALLSLGNLVTLLGEEPGRAGPTWWKK